MLKQVIAAALLSTALIANTAAPAFAGGDEGGSSFWEDRKAKAKKAAKAPAKKAAKAKQAKKAKKKKAKKHAKKGTTMTSRNPDGSSITVTANGDGTRTITERDANGRVTGRRTVGPQPDYAINHTTGVAAVGVAPGVRIVLSPMGLGFSFSN